MKNPLTQRQSSFYLHRFFFLNFKADEKSFFPVYLDVTHKFASVFIQIHSRSHGNIPTPNFNCLQYFYFTVSQDFDEKKIIRSSSAHNSAARKVNLNRYSNQIELIQWHSGAIAFILGTLNVICLKFMLLLFPSPG